MRQPQRRGLPPLIARNVAQVLRTVPDGRHERDRRRQRIGDHRDQGREAGETTESVEAHVIAVVGGANG